MFDCLIYSDLTLISENVELQWFSNNILEIFCSHSSINRRLFLNVDYSYKSDMDVVRHKYLSITS